MASRRTYGSYNDGCAAAHALDLVGERWALIVVRELLLGPKRFVDLQRDVAGVGPGALTQRLQQLEAVGIVTRRTLPPPARVLAYDLTDWGRGLEQVNTALSAWASRSPKLPVHADMSPDSLVLAMRAHTRPVPVPRNMQVTIELIDSRAPGDSSVEYVATLTTSGPEIEKGTTDTADARVQATTRAWKALILGRAPLEDHDEIEITGDSAAVHALLEGTRLELETPEPSSE
ncbi:helix-turn-helix domain-containing protein [Streptomyces sp. ST2-7A]|uniref:winged helix-turn-helix transcriptional regulator n=1 Tax=Streptomyces sp. ST2-7A TaxID=2907214 RepID=UPI001F408866|nr:helix-turn-helix domain-containing protein [Streptomyces sp. ST2-7A]MCE7082797.1 helix-turn-helix transcriptional regulator [Streptomyces sp. ST2-7A]